MRAHCRNCDREQIVPFSAATRSEYQCSVCGRPLTARPKARPKPLQRKAPAKKRRASFSPASTPQRAKVHAPGVACVVCGIDRYEARVDPAHLVDRSLGGCDDPLCVLPLCRRCHRAYDEEGLDLSPYLEPRYRLEVAHAIGHLGLFGALNRITNRRWKEEAA